MRVWTCNDHAGFYPVGVASIIVARSKKTATRLLDEMLAAKGLEAGTGTLVELSLDKPVCVMLADGNY